MRRRAAQLAGLLLAAVFAAAGGCAQAPGLSYEPMYQPAPARKEAPVPAEDAGPDGPLRRVDYRTSGTNAKALDQAVAKAASGEYHEAAELLQFLPERFGNSGDRRRAAEATFWLGYCREKLGRASEARALYGRVTTEYADQRAADQAKRRLTAMGP